LDLKIQYQSIKDELLPKINDILENTSFILGKYVKEFEDNFAVKHNAKYCYCVSTGTAGNHLVLWALRVGPGDEVIVPANTFIATAWGATLCGAKPVFVDCHPKSYNLDPDQLKNAISTKTKAIVAVHLYGQPADIDEIKNTLNEMGFVEEGNGTFKDLNTGQIIYLVEDCAQSHLAEYKGKKVGTLGIASSWSFYPGKNLGAYGEGGAVMTNNEELALKFKMMRDHGSEEKYVHKIFGHNYRMESIQGAVLEVKLKYLDEWTEKRREVANKYYSLLKDVEEIELPYEMSYGKNVYHLFVIKINSEASKRGKSRYDLQKYLNENGISTGLHYPIPLHLQPCFKDLGYKKGDFPISEDLAENCLSLPMYPELSDEQINYVCDKLKNFFKL
ncbi:MAG: DegT/DnrJ/EryC1/StrS family aminotransferase, partial [Ignavibacterium sp.]|nr:DegT/DnrJ/EryC1/StrS family aminotransferase [Ignavibacterium sp.]